MKSPLANRVVFLTYLAACFLLQPALALGSKPTVIESIPEIRALSRSSAASGIPVHLRGVVTALSGWKNSFFISQNSIGISVDPSSPGIAVQVGQEVELFGRASAGLFAPLIVADRLRIIGSAALPSPATVTLGQILDGHADSQRIEIHGVVHSAAVTSIWGKTVLLLNVDTGGRPLEVRVLSFPPGADLRVVDSEILVRGVCGTIFNDKRQIVGIRVFVPDFKDIRVLTPAIRDPFEAPLTSIADLSTFSATGAPLHRVNIAGNLTYLSGNNLYLQDGPNLAVAVQTTRSANLALGSRVEAAGFAALGDYGPILRDATVRAAPRPAIPALPPPVLDLDPAQVIQSRDNFRFAPFDGLVVRVSADLIDRFDHDGEESWILRAGPSVFRTTFPRGVFSGRSPIVPNGARVRVTGICVVQANPLHEPVSFHLASRGSADVSILSVPWWNTSSTFVVIAVLLLACAGLLTWIALSQVDRSRNFPRSLSPADRLPAFQKVSARLGMLAALPAACALIAHAAPQTALSLVLLGLAAFSLVSPRVLPRAILSLAAICAAALSCLRPAFTGAPPGMSASAGLCLVFIGSAFLLVPLRNGGFWRQILAVSSALIGIFDLMANLFGADGRFWPAPGVGVPLWASIGIILLSFSALLAEPAAPIVTSLFARNFGGFVIRRLAPVAFFVPVTLGWAASRGHARGFYGPEIALTLLAFSSFLTFTFFVFVHSRIFSRLQSDKSRAELDLAKSEQRFRFTFEQAAVGIAHVSPEGRFLKVNEKLCSIVGYSREELAARTFGDITFAEDLEKDWALARSLLQDESKTYSMDKRYWHKNGSLVWVRITVSLVRAESRAPEYFIAVIEEIGERVASQQALAESERHFRGLAEAMPQIVWTASAAGDLQYCNNRWFRFTRESDNGPAPTLHDLEALIHPDDSGPWRAAWRAALENSQPYEIEFRFWDRANSLFRWFLGRGVPISGADGLALSWIGAYTDIHQRKQFEIQLSQSERTLRERDHQLALIFESGGIGDFTWHVADDRLEAHPAIWKMYGDPDNTAPRPAAWFRARQHPGDVPLIDEHVNAMLERGQPFHGEFRVVRDDGSIAWVSCHSLVVREASGAIAKVIGLNIDITARKEAELTLRQSREEFRLLCNAIPQIVWTARADGYVDFYNDRWYDFTGAPREAGGDASWIPVLHHDDVQPCIDRWRNCVSLALPFEMELRYWNPRTRQYRWHLGRGLPLRSADGAVLRWFGSCTDIQAQKESKQVLELAVCDRTAQLKRAVDEKDTLLREIHHRVKNNLQVVSSLLKMQGDSVSDAAAAAALHDSQRRVLSMALIHERLYGTEGMDEIEFGEYLHTLVAELFRCYRAPSRDISSSIDCDRLRLTIDQAIPCGLIVNELVTNSLKYAFPGNRPGVISVHLRSLSAERIELSVSDDGVGLPAGFNWKASKSLGLPIVDVLSRQLEGTLNVDQRNGLSFCIAFPFRQKSTQTSVAA